MGECRSQSCVWLCGRLTWSRSVGWVRARDLSAFDFNAPNWQDIPYYPDALDYYAQCRKYQSFQQMREAGAPLPSVPVVSSGGAAPSSVPRHEDRGMADAGAVQVDDSDASRSISDSDSDVEMANTESRRTSVSNRGESQEERIDKGAPPTEAAPARVIEPGPGPRGQPSNAGIARTLAETAQLSLNKASPLRTTSPLAHSKDTEVPRARPLAPRPGPLMSSEQGYRRVEKIYAHSNPNRTSRSPRIVSATLPQNRTEGPTQQPSAPTPQAAPRLPSPASLQNILQSQPTSSYVPRPGPLHQQGLMAEPQEVRRIPSPLQHPLASAEAATARNLEPPAISSPKSSRIPSPLQMPTRQMQQPAQEQAVPEQTTPAIRAAPAVVASVSNPPSRGSTPTISIRIDATLPQDRWRAVRNPSQTESTASQSPPPPRVWKQPTPPVAVPVAESARPILSPLPPPPVSQSSSAGTRPSSPSQAAVRSPSIPVKTEQPTSFPAAATAGEAFDVSLLASLDPTKVEASFRLTVDKATGTAKTPPGVDPQLVIDPSQLKQVAVEATMRSDTARVVRMTGNDGTQRTLLFDTSDVGRGVQAGGVHARRFCRWVINRNPSIDYTNQR